MGIRSFLQEIWYEETSTVLNFIGRNEIGLNHSGSEMRYNLKKRGLTDEQIDSLKCECGEANSLEDIVSVSKTPEKGVVAHCKACF